MSPIRKKALLTTSAAGLLVMAWLGASIHGAGLAESELRAFSMRPSSETGFKIMNLQHDRGLLSSSGSFELQRVTASSDDPGHGATLELRYALKHLILPGSRMRVEWAARPAGESADELAALFGAGLKVEGRGELSLGGDFRSSMTLPELAANSEGTQLNVSPSSGQLTLGERSLALKWDLDRLMLRGNGRALELKQIALDMDLKDRQLGTGTTTLTIEKIASSEGTLEGFRHATQVLAQDRQVDVRVTESLRSGRMGGQDIKDVVFELALNGLDQSSIETLSQLLADTSGMQNATAEEQERFRKTMRALLTRGFSIGIPRLSGTVGKGSIEGRLNVDAQKAARPDAPIALAGLLGARGELVLRGDALSPDQQQMAIAMGLAQAIEGGLKADFEYSNGLLRANGRVLDGARLDPVLQQADQALNAFFTPGAPGNAVPLGESLTEQRASGDSN